MEDAAEVVDTCLKQIEKPMECSDDEDTDPNEVCVERICLIGNLTSDETVNAAAEKFKVAVDHSNDGNEWSDGPRNVTVFVLEEFSGPVFDDLRQRGHRLLGPTALKDLAEKNMSLLCYNRPLFSTAMLGLVVCFTGFRIKEELCRLIFLIHSMGGSIRKNMSSKVTHLIANSCISDKYRYAFTFRVPIMSKEWVHNAWAMRMHEGFNASSNQMNNFKLKPFHGARVCFVGFPEDEQRHMSEILIENGGEQTDIDDPTCTHLVIDDIGITGVNSFSGLSSNLPPSAVLVKPEWFWTSVQHQICVIETPHLYLETTGNVNSQATPQLTIGLASTPGSLRGARKRKRLTLCSSSGGSGISSVANCATTAAGVNSGSPALSCGAVGTTRISLSKRRSSVSDANLLSCSGSFLDCSHHADILDNENEQDETQRKNLSARHQVFLELLQTESNYVGILNTIMHMFKAPLEELLENSDEQLLNATELKIIFGNLPPIYVTHCQMLENFKSTAQNWKEDVSIGNIYLKFAPDLEKAYPPFVNFFENTREMLSKCDESKPRFHAFLKALQTKPECGRQSLHELLIRPIQRLPSVSLLLTDMLKHTHKNNPDHGALEKAISAVKAVMNHINEDKRRTEGQMVIFNIFNEIENCPPQLISSHRSFINKCDVVELSDSLSKKGDPLVLYLFSDMLEICKKRSKVFNSLKSPNATLGSKINHNCKPYKHIYLLPLAAIKRVVDITETEDCKKVFALMCCSTTDLKEKLFSFAILEEEVDKIVYLKTLCRHSANTSYRIDSENILASLDPESISVDTSDVGLGTLGKAFKFASRTRMKVGRALSFNKTPSKLKRAVSTMMSPFGSTNNLTPSTQLAQMRLASCANINELANSGSSLASPVSGQQPLAQYQAPMSVQPVRRAVTNKLNTISVSSLRRL